MSKKFRYWRGLRLTPEELDRMTSQLGGIVAYIEQLAELDDEIKIHQVQANGPTRLEMTQRLYGPDEVRPSLDRTEALASARRSTTTSAI